MSDARTHIPAWRAKGYLAIENDNSVKPKLATSYEQNEYQPFCVHMSNETETVRVEADYVLR
jgi:hypothetical protein